ncbi:hypothetical protein ACPA9J_07685 [Pseudomonas aeruginosa]
MRRHTGAWPAAWLPCTGDKRTGSFGYTPPRSAAPRYSRAAPGQRQVRPGAGTQGCWPRRRPGPRRYRPSAAALDRLVTISQRDGPAPPLPERLLDRAAPVGQGGGRYQRQQQRQYGRAGSSFFRGAPSMDCASTPPGYPGTTCASLLAIIATTLPGRSGFGENARHRRMAARRRRVTGRESCGGCCAGVWPIFGTAKKLAIGFTLVLPLTALVAALGGALAACAWGSARAPGDERDQSRRAGGSPGREGLSCTAKEDAERLRQRLAATLNRVGRLKADGDADQALGRPRWSQVLAAYP